MVTVYNNTTSHWGVLTVYFYFYKHSSNGSYTFCLISVEY